MANPYTNLYVWFSNGTERRRFVMELLQLKPEVPKRKGKRAAAEARERQRQLDAYLDMMEEGKTKSPYYALSDLFYRGRLPENINIDALPPWHEARVFQRGFRRIYTQKSYYYRPGHWLVIQFRHTPEGWERRNWVLGQIPAERLGTNVPIPQEIVDRRTLVWAEGLLQRFREAPQEPSAVRSLNSIYEKLRGIKARSPELFQGDLIYLWERLAFRYYDIGLLDKATNCLELQAQLRPEDSDVYLTMGALYAERDMWPLALKAYMKGLELEPNNEYILYNLAAHYLEQGDTETARIFIERLSNGSSNGSMHYKLRADAYYEEGKPEEALALYQQALAAAEKEINDPAYIAEIHTFMANIYREWGQEERVLESLRLPPALPGIISRF